MVINQAVWFALSALIVGGIVRAINTDGMSSLLSYLAGRTKDDPPVNVPARLLPWLALLFGGASAALDAKIGGADAQSAIAAGIGSAAAAAFGHSLGKSVPVVKSIVKGRSSTLVVALLFAASMYSVSACKAVSSPGADADAAIAVATDACSLIEGIDDNGAIRNICATVEEIAQVIAFVVTLRGVPDGGPVATASCANLPGTSFCATSAERAKGVLFVVRARMARLTLDGGS